MSERYAPLKAFDSRSNLAAKAKRHAQVVPHCRLEFVEFQRSSISLDSFIVLGDSQAVGAKPGPFEGGDGFRRRGIVRVAAGAGGMGALRRHRKQIGHRKRYGNLSLESWFSLDFRDSNATLSGPLQACSNRMALSGDRNFASDIQKGMAGLTRTPRDDWFRPM